MRRNLLLAVVVLLAGWLGIAVWYWDSAAPEIRIQEVEAVGPQQGLNLTVEDAGRGIAFLEISLLQGDRRITFLQTRPEASFWPWGAKTRKITPSIPGAYWRESGLEEGPFSVEVTARDHADLLVFSDTGQVTKSLRLDATPPRVEVLSKQHYLRQGGSEIVLYRVPDDVVESGVKVGDRKFRGYELSEGMQIALFALAHDQPADVGISVWARDDAGNEGLGGFFCKTFPQEFRSRRIQIGDSFIRSVVPEILSQTPDVEQPESLREQFLFVNRDLRRRNNAQIVELTKSSEARRLWEEPFLQLSNSKVESLFADHRSYYYEGEKIDEQTHLGFDLASLSRSPVEAANRGVVVFADYLGIYGNTVILDHGWGLFSLYGHLSSLAVTAGDRVMRGEELGRTGQTGLAGGDHLHFSMILQGVQINPLEWWDPSWLQAHLLSKLPAS